MTLRNEDALYAFADDLLSYLSGAEIRALIEYLAEATKDSELVTAIALDLGALLCEWDLRPPKGSND